MEKAKHCIWRMLKLAFWSVADIFISNTNKNKINTLLADASVQLSRHVWLKEKVSVQNVSLQEGRESRSHSSLPSNLCLACQQI